MQTKFKEKENREESKRKSMNIIKKKKRDI